MYEGFALRKSRIVVAIKTKELENKVEQMNTGLDDEVLKDILKTPEKTLSSTLLQFQK